MMPKDTKYRPPKGAISRIICWKCGKGGAKGDSPLRKISKTDYVCEDDLAYGKPPVNGMSEYFFTEEDRK